MVRGGDATMEQHKDTLTMYLEEEEHNGATAKEPTTSTFDVHIVVPSLSTHVARKQSLN